MDKQENVSFQLLTAEEVMQRTAFGRTKLYALIKTGEFPKPINISERSVRWLESELLEWMQARLTARDAEAENLVSRRKSNVARQPANSTYRHVIGSLG